MPIYTMRFETTQAWKVIVVADNECEAVRMVQDEDYMTEDLESLDDGVAPTDAINIRVLAVEEADADL